MLLAVPAFGQMGSPPGVPASATSITPQNPTPGVPASVTSFSAFHPPSSTGFTAFNPPPSTSFTAFHPPGMASSGGFSSGFGGHRGFGHHRGVVAVPVYYPAYSPVYDTSYAAQPEPEAAPQPEAPSGNAMDRELWSRAAEREDKSMDRRDSYLAQQDPRYGEDHLHHLDGRERANAGS